MANPSPESNRIFQHLAAIDSMLALRGREGYLLDEARREATRLGIPVPPTEFLLTLIRQALANHCQALSPKSLKSGERIENARRFLQSGRFSRKDYLAVYPSMSEVTASRDLRQALEAGILKSYGTHARTLYEWGQAAREKRPVPSSPEPRAPKRLLRALLFEMASGNYHEGQRFLSHRKIMRLWKVSTPTAQKALQMLCEQGLVRTVDSSGHYLCKGFRKEASLLLADLPSAEETAIDLGGAVAVRRRQSLQTVMISRRSSNAALRIGILYLGADTLPQPTTRLERASRKDFAPGATARSIFLEAEKAGGRVNFLAIPSRTLRDSEIVTRIVNIAPDGIVIIRRIADSLAPLAETVLRRFIPVVAAFDDCEGTEMISVNFNNPAMGAKAASLFLQSGHRRIGVLLPSKTVASALERASGLEDALLQNGITLTKFTLCENASLAEAEAVAASLRRQKITALYSTWHELIEGLLPALQNGGMRVPEDLSVLSSSFNAEVSSSPGKVDILRMDFGEIGRIAYRALWDFRHGQTTQRCHLLTPPYEAYGTMRHVS